jgi:lipid-A-disaccharide synthase
MGFIEPLKRLPELLKIRSTLKKYFIKNKPTVFIGIDAPDFNLSLEHSLKNNGITTVHYVSPTVWAWRKGRIHKIKKAIDHMLCLFPFETQIYQSHAVPITCVGHPLADSIPLHSDQSVARTELNLPLNSKIIALLPGSRTQELNYLAKEFIETARWLKARDPELRFIAASANGSTYEQFKGYLAHYKDVKVDIFQGNARTVMAASDAILTVSGTASLEAMLVKRPTVVAYKMSALGFAIAKRLIRIPYIALPNLLAGKLLMKEFVQSAVNPAAMGQVILEYLQSPLLTKESAATFLSLHHSLKKNAGQTAASAIQDLIKEY